MLQRSIRHLTTFILPLLICGASSQSENDFVSIFNGKDLSGWEGDHSYWKIKDGVITGQTTPEKPTQGNTFLIWKGDTPANFELRLSFRLTGQNDKSFANSGVQYRSRRIEQSGYVVGGYQADLDLAGKYAGMLYEERGRGLLMTPGERIRILPPETGSDKKAQVENLGQATSKEDILAIYEQGEWNEFVIIAEGNHLRHFLNGKLTADVIDDDPDAAATSGIIALQLHQGPPMTAQFKDLLLRKLP